MVNNILNIIVHYRVDIIVTLAVLLAVYLIRFYMIKYDKSGKVRKIVTALCVEAEKYLGSKTGQLKKEQVVTWFYIRYKFLGLFITKQTLSNLIDNVVESINDYLEENNTDLKGIAEENK